MAHLQVLTGDFLKMWITGTSLAVRWMRLHASNAGGAGSIPGRGTKIPHAVRLSQKKKIDLRKTCGLQGSRISMLTNDDQLAWMI